MAITDPISILSEESQLKPEVVSAIVDMHRKGYSIPFMVDFRADETHHTREGTVRKLLERYAELTSPADTDETPAVQAVEPVVSDPVRERLTELALRILDGRDLEAPLESIALEYTLPDHGVTSAEHVLSRVRDIIVERISNNRNLRRSLKNLYSKNAKFASQLKAGAQDRKGEFRRFHHFSTPLGRMSPEDALMVLRGEKRKILEMKFSLDDEAALKHLCTAIIKTEVPVLRFQLETVVAEAYHQNLKPTIEKELRADLVTRAEKMVLSDCANMLRQALHHPVLSGKKLLVIDANKDSGYSAVLIDPNAQIARAEKFSFVKHHPKPVSVAAPSPIDAIAEPVATPADAIPPDQSEQSSSDTASEVSADTAGTEAIARSEMPTEANSGRAVVNDVIAVLKDLIQQAKPDALIIAKRPETRLIFTFIKTLLAKENINTQVIGVSAIALSYEVSAQQLEHEYPQTDPDFLRPLAMARRLFNPVAELAAVSPLSLNLHPLQDDILQAKLLTVLREEFEEIIRPGGIDINQASAGMLRYVPGMDADVAKSIVRNRRQNGRYKCRTDLLKVTGMTPELFLQVAGFVRVYDGSNPLDRTRIHPERYEPLRKIAEHLQTDFGKILRRPDLLRDIDPQKFARPGLSAQTLRGLLEEMQNPYTAETNRPLDIIKFDPKIVDTKDLVVGTTLQGRVTNLTDYGAFVDIGIHQDGLVHKTEMAREFIKEPTRYLRLGQLVTVKVEAVEVGKNRITLTMKDVQQIRPPRPEVGTRPGETSGLAARFGDRTPHSSIRPQPGRRDGRPGAREGAGGPGGGRGAPRAGFGGRGGTGVPGSGRGGPRTGTGGGQSERPSADRRPPRPFDRPRHDRHDRPQKPQKQAPQPNVFGTFGEAFKKFIPVTPTEAAPSLEPAAPPVSAAPHPAEASPPVEISVPSDSGGEV